MGAPGGLWGRPPVRLSAPRDLARSGPGQAIETLAAAGNRWSRIDVATKYDLGEELIRWEIATAIAGAMMGINPFDQPDVESSKVATRELTAGFEKTGALPAETPFFDGGRRGAVRRSREQRNAHG